MTRTAVITGAASGIGLALTRLLDREGWQVIGTHLPTQPVDALRAGASTRVRAVPLDMTEPASIGMFATAVANVVRDDGVNVLVNAAGIAGIAEGPMEGVSLDGARRTFEVNVFGTLQVTQAILPFLHAAGPGRARILTITSGNVEIPIPVAGVYMMSKCALDGMVRTLRVELAPFGIESIAIEPGAVRTAMTANARGGLDRTWEKMSPSVRKRYEHVLRPANERLAGHIDRANEPQEIAEGMYEIIRRRAPKPRYMIGKDVGVVPALQRILPARAFETLVLHQLNLTRRTAP